VSVFSCSAASCIATPIDLAGNTPVYISLYGTGLRLGQNAMSTVGGITAPLLYAGAQPGYPGLDQVNLELPVTLRGRGEVAVVLTVDGQKTNSAFVTIR
jgi:uncharacterized protein (TIGR03437 family)